MNVLLGTTKYPKSISNISLVVIGDDIVYCVFAFPFACAFAFYSILFDGLFYIELDRFGNVRGSYGFWKVMETDNAVFQDLESFGKGRFFKMAMGKF